MSGVAPLAPAAEMEADRAKVAATVAAALAASATPLAADDALSAEVAKLERNVAQVGEATAAVDKAAAAEVAAAAEAKATAAERGVIAAGMKVEALDRANPTMTCVATIAELDAGRCLIHFDGWSNRWDYWTALPDKDVHPVGWCQRNSVNLQPPKNHVGVFEWQGYLAEQGATAAPLGDEAAVAPATAPAESGGGDGGGGALEILRAWYGGPSGHSGRVKDSVMRPDASWLWAEGSLKGKIVTAEVRKAMTADGALDFNPQKRGCNGIFGFGGQWGCWKVLAVEYRYGEGRSRIWMSGSVGNEPYSLHLGSTAAAGPARPASAAPEDTGAPANPSQAKTTPDSITVSGANTCHGGWPNDSWGRDGSANGRPRWKRRGNSHDKIQWDGTRWALNGNPGVYYQHPQDSPLPPKSGWVTADIGGHSAMPVLSYKGGGSSDAEYHVNTATMNWQQHEDAAKAWGGHLVSILSQNELNHVKDLCRGKSCWIGGRRIGTGNGTGDRHWAWSDGHPWGFEKWQAGEPNNWRGREDRVQMYASGNWNDLAGGSGGQIGVYKRGQGEYTPPPPPPAPAIAADGTLIVPAEPCRCEHKPGRACCILNPVPLPWHAHEALANCCGGHLASIHSDREHCAAATCALYSWAWLGGRRIEGVRQPAGVQGSRGADAWEWSDGTAWDYTNFMGGEPNNGAGGESKIHFLCCTQWNDCGEGCCCFGLYQWRLRPTVDAVARPVMILTIAGGEAVEGADGSWHSAATFADWARPLLVARDLCGPDDVLTFVLETGGIVPAGASGEDLCKLGDATARHLQVEWSVGRPLRIALALSADDTDPVVERAPLLQPAPGSTMTFRGKELERQSEL